MKRRMRLLLVAFLGAMALLVGTVGAAAMAVENGGGTTLGTQAAGNTIRSNMNGKCLEVLGYATHNGAASGMWDCYIGGNQLWY